MDSIVFTYLEYHIFLQSGNFHVTYFSYDTFSIFTLGQKDNETDKFIEARLGLGYENCCFAASLTASKRTLIRFNEVNISNNMFLNDLWDNIIGHENKSRINISFQLKGFNNTKRGFKRYIQNSILN